MTTTDICNAVAHEIMPTFNTYCKQEIHNGKTYSGSDLAPQLFYNVVAMESVKIKNGQTLNETKAYMQCYLGNIFNKSYVSEIAERIYLCTKEYTEG